MIQNYINHIVFVVDASGSMAPMSNDVVKVFDGQIAHLANRSKEVNQETRVSVYLFSNSDATCLIYDMDVMRLPSLRSHYDAHGGTPLIKATIKAIEDLKKTPEMYADHAFLIYVLTDGEENQSYMAPESLKNTIQGLKDNWTVACLVPNAHCMAEAKRFGFPAQNVQVWSTDSAGVKEVGEVIRKATDNFMAARATGMRSTKNLFNLDTTKLNTTKVKTTLSRLTPSKDYELLTVHKEAVIQPFVESWIKTEPYRKGSAYYQLTKPEKVQNYKQVCVQEKTTGHVYSGPEARQILGLPDYEIKVNPASHNKFNIFVQSTSTNRKLVAGTQLIVLK